MRQSSPLHSVELSPSTAAVVLIPVTVRRQSNASFLCNICGLFQRICRSAVQLREFNLLGTEHSPLATTGSMTW